MSAGRRAGRIYRAVRILRPHLYMSVAAGLWIGLSTPAGAQLYVVGRPAPVKPAREAAPIDVTGYWVSYITQDWRRRMVVPPKGDFPGGGGAIYPLNAAGQKIASEWNPAVKLTGEAACKPYGAPQIMRLPDRLHIEWTDANTLTMQIDSGNQTRIFHFAPAATSTGGAAGSSAQPGMAPSRQGYSVARWDVPGNTSRGPAAPAAGGGLEVTTTNLLAGYLELNGVPYSDKTRMTEYYDLVTEPDNSRWLIEQAIVTDPVYLFNPYITSVQFQSQPDARGWDPAPCGVYYQ